MIPPGQLHYHSLSPPQRKIPARLKVYCDDLESKQTNQDYWWRITSTTELKIWIAFIHFKNLLQSQPAKCKGSKLTNQPVLEAFWCRSFKWIKKLTIACVRGFWVAASLLISDFSCPVNPLLLSWSIHRWIFSFLHCRFAPFHLNWIILGVVRVIAP